MGKENYKRVKRIIRKNMEIKEKTQSILIISICIITIIGMSIWMWPKWCENANQSWIDKWDEQMK